MGRLAFQAEQTTKLRDKGLPSKATWVLPGRVGRVETQRSRKDRVLGGGAGSHQVCCGTAKTAQPVACFAKKKRTRA